ncbi:MAG: amino acid dehydrogenase [Neomegalonema sp.]|nr:amino acid dehydrogenase [Neomegalonema sp.]
MFDHPDFDHHEQVVFVADPAAGLRAIIAVHDTTLGPGLGGCRIRRYDSDDAALTDVLRLSRGMTFKAALAALPLGGGKSVILADAETEKTEAMMRAMGQAVERLGGRYIAAEDVGATPADMDAMAVETSHVSGLSTGVGDPAPWTAKGVFLCLNAVVEHILGRSDLKGLRVAVKGLGAVGGRLAMLLSEAGAELIVADLDPARAAQFAADTGATQVATSEIAHQAADVYAPCALGGEFDATTIPKLGAQIICGAANNQLAADADADRLSAAGHIYCPDYLVNAGGLISVSRTAIGMSDARAEAKLAALPETLKMLLDRTGPNGGHLAIAADAIVRERLAAARGGA